MKRLYRLKSILNNFSHKGSIYDGVEVFWFVVYRDNLEFSQERQTNGHDNSERQFYISEGNIYELFSEEESILLKEYLLRDNRAGCEIKETDVDIEVETRGYGDRVLGHKEGYYRMDLDFNYDLPLIVWGYYDVTYAKDISWLAQGVESMKMVLDKFGITITNINKLKTTIEDLKSTGIFKEKNINLRERLTN